MIVDSAGEALYLLDFGNFDMHAERGVVEETKVKHQHIHWYNSICTSILITLPILVLISCTNTNGGDVGENISFPSVTPSSTPLICPNNQRNGGQGSFVSKKGTTFIYHSSPLKLYGFTFYPSTIGGASAWHTLTFTHYIDHILDMGKQAGQNLVRPTDFWDQSDHRQKQDDGNVWKNVDYLVCAAQKRGMFVVLDVSAFQKYLLSQGRDPFDARNWRLFLDAVGNHYKNQSSIAFYSIVGEPPPPTNVAAMNKLVEFYRGVTDELRRVDGTHHLITAGGFNHMEEESPSIPWWHKIYSLPNNNIVAFKTYSADDLNLISKVSAFAEELGKPLVDEEFGLPQSMGDGTYTGGPGYNDIKMSRAQFFEDVYTKGEEYGVTGFVFWNMGCEIKGQSYEVNPMTPAAWQVIKKYAPDKPTAPNPKEPICYLTRS